MFQRTFQQVLRFFGTIATALAGVGAMATAIGFLAERSRWSMLGFTASPADLNEYLFTGARFLAFLPGIVLASVLTVLAESLIFVATLLAAAAIVPMVRRFRLPGRSIVPARRSPGTGGVGGRWARRAVPWGLGALAIGQFVGTLFLFQAGRLRNVLFVDRPVLAGAECRSGRLSLEEQILLGCERELTEHMGWGFLIVLLCAAAFWFLLRHGLPPAGEGDPEDAGDRGRGPVAEGMAVPTVLIAVNAALLSIQLILLPINYGVLFLRNDFSVVEVTLARADLVPEGWPADGRLTLLHRESDEFYLYAAAARRIWLFPRSEVGSMTYLGICGVFEPFEQCRSEEVLMRGGIEAE
jgi:hypothetical protein